MKTIFSLFSVLAIVTAGAVAQQTAAPAPSTGASTVSNAAPAAVAGDASLASPVTSTAYVLRPQDVVQITVYREPDLTTLVRLAGDGSITFPLIGRVIISGMTVQQAQDVITKRLGADYLVNPQVTMSVTEYTKQRFTVLGQVQRPGAYDLPGEGKLSLLQAIGMAGGFTRMANPASVVVKRKTTGNQEKVTKVNANKLAKEDSEGGFPIEAGDTISVPEGWF